MATFKLLAGQHIQADPDWEPSEEDKALAKETGVAPKAPSRVYNQGQMVESDTDLVARFGAQKFALVGGKAGRGVKATRGLETPGDVTEEIEQESPAVFPGGQVSTGRQVTTGVPGTRESVSGPDTISHSEREKLAVKAGNLPKESASKESGVSKGGGASKGKTTSDADLDNMTVEELKQHAADEEISLHGATTKADIVKAIKKEQKQASGEQKK